MTCPDCEGQASYYSHSRPWADERLCGTCDGSGEVTDEREQELEQRIDELEAQLVKVRAQRDAYKRRAEEAGA